MGFWIWEAEEDSNFSVSYFYNLFSFFPFSNTTILNDDNNNDNSKHIVFDSDRVYIDIDDNNNNNNVSSSKKEKNIYYINDLSDHINQSNNDTTRNKLSKINKILINNLNRLPKILSGNQVQSISKDSCDDNEETVLLHDQNADISLHSSLNSSSFNHLPFPRKKSHQIV